MRVKKLTLLIVGLLTFPHVALAQYQGPGTNAAPVLPIYQSRPMPVQPPPTVITPFGNGMIANTPGRPPTTIQPYGNGYIANTPGQMPTTIQPFGNGYIVNGPR